MFKNGELQVLHIVVCTLTTRYVQI